MTPFFLVGWDSVWFFVFYIFIFVQKVVIFGHFLVIFDHFLDHLFFMCFRYTYDRVTYIYKNQSKKVQKVVQKMVAKKHVKIDHISVFLTRLKFLKCRVSTRVVFSLLKKIFKQNLAIMGQKWLNFGHFWPLFDHFFDPFFGHTHVNWYRNGVKKKWFLTP